MNNRNLNTVVHLELYHPTITYISLMRKKSFNALGAAYGGSWITGEDVDAAGLSGLAYGAT